MNAFQRYFQHNVVTVPSSFPDNLAIIVIIPVLDDWDIFCTLESLADCRLSEGNAGFLVVVNYSEECGDEVKKRNRLLASELKAWVINKAISGMWFEIVEAFELPAKSAGVGLARKIAMDQAACYFYHIGYPERPIASLDADTLVDSGYLDEIIRSFRGNPVAGVSIDYAHRLDDRECAESARDAVIKYELYLRYYQQALLYSGHPYAFTCIGSAFAVRTLDYVEQGGMNKRQAGEDFYFLQKLISTGRFKQLSSVRVYPSARLSTRTPFGTGQAIRQIIEDKGEYLTYHFDSFRGLKSFFAGIAGLYKTDSLLVEKYICMQTPALRHFLIQMDAVGVIMEINANCASEKQFVKRFFDNFNAFRVLKYLNYAHPDFYLKTDILQAVHSLLTELGFSSFGGTAENLELMRKL